MSWKVVATLRYHRSHPDAAKRGKIFHSESHVTYATRGEAERQAVGSAMMDRKLGRKGVVYSVKPARSSNPLKRARRGSAARKGSYPRGKTPPHLKKYLFKKGHK